MKIRLIGLLILCSCRNYFGPVPVDLDINQDTEVAISDNQSLKFMKDDIYPAELSLNASKKSLTLKVENDKIKFKNVTWSTEDGHGHIDAKIFRIALHPMKSNVKTTEGLKLGISLVGKALCPESGPCHEDNRELIRRTCYRIERKPVTRCYRDRRGQSRCETHWEDVRVYGWETIERVARSLNYDVNASILDENDQLRIGAAGLYEHVDVFENIVRSCW